MKHTIQLVKRKGFKLEKREMGDHRDPLVECQRYHLEIDGEPMPRHLEEWEVKWWTSALAELPAGHSVPVAGSFKDLEARHHHPAGHPVASEEAEAMKLPEDVMLRWLELQLKPLWKAIDGLRVRVSELQQQAVGNKPSATGGRTDDLG
jgi:hypothetical protein